MKALQTNLFISIKQLITQPLILAYGLGVDSTAVLVELRKRGIRPDAILFADTGNEKQQTYDYLPIINSWLESVGFPQVTIVKYTPVNLNGYPPYSTLGENCLTNGTLPSLAFGFKSCSLKWKVVPQNKWTEAWIPARDCWASGAKVKKIIGYDASAKDLKRYAHVKNTVDDKYEYWYPLIEWGMDRDDCKQAILAAGLPVPPKSACTFCPATQPSELDEHRKEYLRYIVIMEARAKPRLQGCMTTSQLQRDYSNRLNLWNQKIGLATGKKLKKLLDNPPKLINQGSGCAGLWRKSTKKRPAMMTDYIATHRLLDPAEIQFLQEQAVAGIIKNQQDHTSGNPWLDWHDFLEMFSPEDALDECSKPFAACSK